MKAIGLLALLGSGWLTLAAPAFAGTSACDPEERHLFCSAHPISEPVCSALQASTAAGSPQSAIASLVAAAATARTDFILGNRLDGSRLLACRLLELNAREPAASVLRDGLDSVIATVSATGRDEGALPPIARAAILQAKVGFEPDLKHTIIVFERVATEFAAPADAVFARSVSGLGFAHIGRFAMARAQFRKALETAIVLPERDGGDAPRFGAVQTVVQFEAEAGLWDMADSALPHLEAAAAVIDDLPDAERDRANMRLSVDRLRRAVERRESPARP